MFPDDPGVRGYALRSIRVQDRIVVPPEIVLSRERRWTGQGWILVGAPSRETTALAGSGRFSDAGARYERAARHTARLRALGEELTKSAPDPRVVTEVTALAEYAEGAASAVGGSPSAEGARAPYSQTVLRLGQQAWQWEVCRMAGDCRGGTLREGGGQGGSGGASAPQQGAQPDGGSLDSSGAVAAPGNTAQQRLGQSGRPAKEEQNQRACDAVRRDRDEAEKLRQAFGDAQLARKANKEGWEIQEYKHEVAKRVFGPDATESSKDKPGNYEPPMWTDPTTCLIHERWTLKDYLDRGYPEVSYRADQAHEAVHRTHCKKFRNSAEYNAKMSFPTHLGPEEEQAYARKVEVLDAWLKENCP